MRKMRDQIGVEVADVPDSCSIDCSSIVALY